VARATRNVHPRNLRLVDDPAGGLTLTVLGCSGTYAAPGGACSGYLVRSAATTLAVDLGSGTLANLQRHVDIADLDAVVLTHEHPDHWLDLPLLRNAMRYVLDLADLPVYGTAGTARLAGALISELTPTLKWTVVDDTSEVKVGDLAVRFGRTDHPVETLAVRVDGGGRSLLYSADTGSGWDPRPLGEGVDLLLCEASLPTQEEDRFEHLSGRQAGAYAASLGAGRLVLTHIAPAVDPDEQRREAAGEYAGPIEMATSGAVFPV
jgi:ribonuclease BN (tRNA processing enzyme)